MLNDKFTLLFDENKRPSWDAIKVLYRENLGLWDKIKVSAEEEKELKNIYLSAIGKDEQSQHKIISELSHAGVQLLNKKAKVGWTSRAHTASAVPVFAIGVGAERFTGWHDNTEIVPLLRRAIEQ